MAFMLGFSLSLSLIGILLPSTQDPVRAISQILEEAYSDLLHSHLDLECTRPSPHSHWLNVSWFERLVQPDPRPPYCDVPACTTGLHSLVQSVRPLHLFSVSQGKIAVYSLKVMFVNFSYWLVDIVVAVPSYIHVTSMDFVWSHFSFLVTVYHMFPARMCLAGIKWLLRSKAK